MKMINEDNMCNYLTKYFDIVDELNEVNLIAINDLLTI